MRPRTRALEAKEQAVAAYAIISAVDRRACANTTKKTTQGGGERVMGQRVWVYRLLHRCNEQNITRKNDRDEAGHRPVRWLHTPPWLTSSRRGHTPRSHP